jgi:hypothetical protein
MLVIDRFPQADLSVDDLIERLLRMVIDGLRLSCSTQPLKKGGVKKTNR